LLSSSANSSPVNGSPPSACISRPNHAGPFNGVWNRIERQAMPERFVSMLINERGRSSRARRCGQVITVGLIDLVYLRVSQTGSKVSLAVFKALLCYRPPLLTSEATILGLVYSSRSPKCHCPQRKWRNLLSLSDWAIADFVQWHLVIQRSRMERSASRSARKLVAPTRAGILAPYQAVARR